MTHKTRQVIGGTGHITFLFAFSKRFFWVSVILFADIKRFSVSHMSDLFFKVHQFVREGHIQTLTNDLAVPPREMETILF